MSPTAAAPTAPGAAAAEKQHEPVTVRREQLVIPTYRPCPADPFPQFIENRVYQGSNGKAYPLPFIDRIEEEPTDQEWEAVWLENEFVSLMILPQLAGRIHVGQDKTSGYDFFYRQKVIKPALVGLAGPWISGGVEFNWPQHHRPSTFMPCDVQVEHEVDGAVTVWCSEHEPLGRMKGMHGVRLAPGSSLIELRVRLYNRTPLTQTFLWWANLGVAVHSLYQSFFPPDVHHVADHANRAVVEFPECRGRYYGVNYSPGTDLSWYKNIPVPTSFMVASTDNDFFGGYDHAAHCGVVHVANHHIAPGKKQWTWGNHAFGRTWDRNLTDPDESGRHVPYIELMAGVYTDNQPDFSFLAPGETKTFSQHWFPLRAIGCAQHANLHGAVSLTVHGEEAAVGVHTTRHHPQAIVTLLRCSQGAAQPLQQWEAELGPGTPLVRRTALPGGCAPEELILKVEAGGCVLLQYSPQLSAAEGEAVPSPATEPPAPQDVPSCDELYLIGLHLEQYRHPTRDPTAYWREALARDPGDARCNNALGLTLLRRGEFSAASRCFHTAVARLTARNPNPADGEPHYNLGLALRWLDGRDKEAYAALYKATWNFAWRAPAFFQLAQMDAARGDWEAAAEHCRAALATNVDFLQARNLCAAVLRRAGRAGEAAELIAGTRTLDGLDWWANHLEGGAAAMSCDAQTVLDVAFDYTDAGLFEEALDSLSSLAAEPTAGSAPLVHYCRAFCHHRLGQAEQARECLAAGATAPITYVFPSRLQELRLLEFVVEQAPGDASARYFLGCLLYDKHRHGMAIALWEDAVRLDPDGPLAPAAWRNLGCAYFNKLKDPRRAAAAYELAQALAPKSSRLLYEKDQLSKRCRVPPAKRLAALEARMNLVRERDALAVESCALYNQLGRPQMALELLQSRRFQPWEGGEGQVLAQHVRSHLALGRAALAGGHPEEAVRLFGAALEIPHNLGEAKHLLANDADARYWLGEALAAAGRQEEATQQWAAAAAFRGDFQGMAVCPFSEMTLYSALALRRLGREAEARAMLEQLAEYAQQLGASKAKVDYFATSLPTMLLFHDDLQDTQEIKALFLEAQACWGLGQARAATALVTDVLHRDPAHGMAADLAAELLAQGQQLSGLPADLGHAA